MSDDFIKETKIPGVFIIERPTFSDERGFFRETFRKNDLDAHLPEPFVAVQENHSHSAKGVLRGIHVAPWYKMVQCVSGEVQQVVVDLRKDSPTYGEHISLIMGESNRVKVLIPPSCGNAFQTISDESDYLYLTTDYWAPGKEYGVAWDDPDLKIKWEIPQPLLSDKDKINPKLNG
jgi:dTDP-4-dehydrorhamnose 3,5-epimerase